MGDGLRRKGEDLLFATDATALKRAAGFLSDAENRYLRAQEVTLRARQGFAVRDRVVPMLPFYTRWLAHRRPREESGGPTREMQKSFITLCQETHKLEGLLAQPTVTKTNPSQEELQTLSTQADLVLRLFRELEQSAKAFRLNLEEVDLPSVWRDIDAMLALPFEESSDALDPHKPSPRMELIARKSRIGQRFLVNYARGSMDGDRDVACSRRPEGACSNPGNARPEPDWEERLRRTR